MSLSAPGPGGPPPGGPPPGGPGGPPPGPGPGGPPPGGGEGDPRGLHDLAVDCVTDIQKLATGLAHAGASPSTVAGLTQMGDRLGLVVKILGQGPELNQNNQHEAAAAGGPPPGAGPGGPPPGPPHPGAGPPPGPPHPGAGPPPGPPGAAPGGPPRSIHEATQQLHHAAIAAATERMRAGK